MTIGPLCRLTADVTTAPSLAVAKQLNGSVIDNGDGTFTVPFRLVVENLGTSLLTPLQTVDNLAAAFPAPASVVGVTPVSTSILSGVGTLTANGSFNGTTTTDLLVAGTSSLNPGARGQIDFSVTVDPNGAAGPFFNQATVSGTTTLGGTFDDFSDNGADPDPDGDGIGTEPGTGCPSVDPASNCENDPTIVILGEKPVVGVGKALSGLVDNGDGTFTATFELRVENLGNVDLTDIQVVDNLAATFPLPATVVGVSALAAGMVSGVGTMSANLAFNGVGDTNLLVAATSRLTVGAVGHISFAVTFDPNAVAGSYSNQAVVSALSPADVPISDPSNNGLDPDPSGDGNPNENNPTPITVTGGPVINEVPVAGYPGLILLALLLSAAGLFALRRSA